MDAVGVRHLLTNRRLNAIIGWTLVGVVVLVAVEGVLSGSFLWAGFALAVAGIVALPAVALGAFRTMVPWEVVAVATFPVVGRAVATASITGQVATYLSVAALALLVTVELDLFTAVRMNYGFAVLFVVVTTLATAGTWAVVRWGLDLTLGTQFLLDSELSAHERERKLMWEFVASTVAGLLAGVFLEVYVRRRARVDIRFEEGEVTDPTGGVTE